MTDTIFSSSIIIQYVVINMHYVSYNLLIKSLFFYFISLTVVVLISLFNFDTPLVKDKNNMKQHTHTHAHTLYKPLQYRLLFQVHVQFIEF